MSGGSYNYLCFKSAEDAGLALSDMKKMADRLNELGYKEEAIKTLEIIDSYTRIDSAIQYLEHVWKAVEWMDSGDWGADQVKAAIDKLKK